MVSVVREVVTVLGLVGGTKIIPCAFVRVPLQMCPLRGERARGLAPSAGAGEASFWADPATVGWFKSSRQLQTNLRLARRLFICLPYWCRRMNTASRSSCFESARIGNQREASWQPNVSLRLFFRT